MATWLTNGLIIIAVIAVALADSLIKRAAGFGSWSRAIFSPWMLGAIVLYLVQIILFTLVFVQGSKLSIVGNLQTVFYALTILIIGYVIFHERLSNIQLIGVGLAMVGVYLMNR